MVSAALALESDAAPAGASLGYAVVNDGEVSVLTGLAYEIDRWTAAGWEELHLGYRFRAVGLVISPRKRRDLTAHVPDGAVPGLYRLRKGVRERLTGPGSTSPPLSDGGRFEISAEFRVTAS